MLRTKNTSPADGDAPQILVIAGPTASGKSALSIELAERWNGEIVSCDSQQVYRRLDIGTAKPSAEERRRVRHHLIDVLDPDEQLSAGDFARRADDAIADITARRRLPIVVGGTGLWLRALLFGMIDSPPPNPDLRRRLEEEACALGRAALHRRLLEVDPLAASTIDPQNAVRVIRALELHEATGEKPSDLWARHAFRRFRYRARIWGLDPPRDTLYQRIDARARSMFESGLLDETRALMRDGLDEAPAVRRAIGYPQARAFLRGELTLDEAIEETAKHSRHYAKRQWTWFRAEPDLEWLPWPVSSSRIADPFQGT